LYQGKPEQSEKESNKKAMNDKEKLIAEIARVRLVMEEAELRGESLRVAMMRYKLKEAENALWWDSQRGMAKWLKELEGIV